jgi:hypothetical protein
MRPLDQRALEEVQNIAAEGDLDPETRLANAAELVALRNLHRIAARETRGSLRFIQMINSLPGVGDVAAWKRLVASSRAALAALPALIPTGDKK